MNKILFVVGSDFAIQKNSEASRMAHALANAGCHIQIAVMRGASAPNAPAPDCNITINHLSDSPRERLGAIWKLHALVRSYQPDLIHLWDQQSWRESLLTVHRPRCPVLVSHPLRATTRGYKLPALDRWLFARIDRFVVSGRHEAAYCSRLGIAPQKVIVIPPGVEVPHQSSGNLPTCDSMPIVACVGPLMAGKAYRDAVWAYDVLRHYDSRMQLVLQGQGIPNRDLNHFAERMQIDQGVSTRPPYSDLTPLLEQAAMVWIPARVDAAMPYLVQAMALAKPIITSSFPGTADIIRSAETALLIPPGDKSALCKGTYRLFENPALARQMGEAARASVQQRYALEHIVERYQEMCRRIAA